ncbi:MAG: flagellar assembly protein FliH [Candidatus Thiodiazotropha sp. (ex Lucina aurantia)]|uniref:Flagellar assembly protein FliH n=2 Tax=Candidatus Thiodiazotropha TaxID=1913444 RepID=A0A7Z0VKZ6_9GAMM|nr:flagellar assembly protein FliH [Candidatus Thiodiazotropha endolucinida]MBT3011869.1 flagellar assembly protein FliH [Candidatus Thiodiazotropha sp. (ex Lucina pensylvanica)]MBT3015650.1 flagellar assembly protein FliH [Candidatus Thiodiazotropha taylori]MBT3039485.1 flagellar assembly protein FliH [Candidatus Thiodiazotropha sp. (ex Codakia orbicularis)]MBV2103492.1 flagellar assembly protein FliH [Candidatus Thiodiazotropha sp. (ex Lucina aurantia)]MCU7944790.1 flagellar assembly protein
MKSSSRSDKDSDLDQVMQWLPPEMSDGRVGTPRTLQPPGAPPTAGELEQLQKQAYEEGFEKGKQEGFEFGHKEGLAQAKRDIQHYTAHLNKLLSHFEQPLRDLDDQVEKELLSLVIAIVKQLLRREVKSDPNLIVGVVREALSVLPVSSNNVRLLLHPEDAELIREVYALGDNEVGWSLIEDPVINRGGCKVVTDTSQIDGTLESRLTTLIAPLLASTRAVDSQNE